jgi:hypothetical protein
MGIAATGRALENVARNSLLTFNVEPIITATITVATAATTRYTGRWRF